MKTYSAFTILFLSVILQAADPVLDYVRVVERRGTRMVDIEYKISAPTDTLMTISVFGLDVQNEKVVPMHTLTGDGANGEAIGPGVHKLTWDLETDWRIGSTKNFKVIIRCVSMKDTDKRYMLIDLGSRSEGFFKVTYRPELANISADKYKKNFIVLRRIPRGSFVMGSPATELDRDAGRETQHRVTFTSDFYIGVFEITQYQWELVMGNNPSYFSPSGEGATYSFGIEDMLRPVEGVSWASVRGGRWPLGHPSGYSFVGRLQSGAAGMEFDLPTESQWEHACRTDDDSMSSVEVWNEREIYGTRKVGSGIPNKWGLYDMKGNVWEWCLDWFKMDLGTFARTDPVGFLEGKCRVIRGGGWNSKKNMKRCSSRSYNWPGAKMNDIGFRLACKAE